eukprot:34329-Chlamydomonas_euryale.AAC.1
MAWVVRQCPLPSCPSTGRSPVWWRDKVFAASPISPRRERVLQLYTRRSQLGYPVFQQALGARIHQQRVHKTSATLSGPERPRTTSSQLAREVTIGAALQLPCPATRTAARAKPEAHKALTQPHQASKRQRDTGRADQHKRPASSDARLKQRCHIPQVNLLSSAHPSAAL